MASTTEDGALDVHFSFAKKEIVSPPNTTASAGASSAVLTLLSLAFVGNPELFYCQQEHFDNAFGFFMR